MLNEDNVVADLAKWKRGPYKRNDPDKKLDSPPWWHVNCDGYGGGNSMGGASEEGAIGSYLFTCRSTGSKHFGPNVKICCDFWVLYSFTWHSRNNYEQG